MTEKKRFTFTNAETTVKTPLIRDNDVPLSFCEVKDLLNELHEENEQLKQFIDDLTTKGTGRIDLANGYSYRVSAILTNWKGDLE